MSTHLLTRHAHSRHTARKLAHTLKVTVAINNLTYPPHLALPMRARRNGAVKA
ncbi:MAG: hypothetical protein PUH57_08215 [Prevotellaceae bacterium]|nr:hypothetical protein [Prevotellaceae bacterium]MDY2750097.1 hypothetical protein [Prevotella sp.]